MNDILDIVATYILLIIFVIAFMHILHGDFSQWVTSKFKVAG